jgi:hypothetical protein
MSIERELQHSRAWNLEVLLAFRPVGLRIHPGTIEEQAFAGRKSTSTMSAMIIHP